jgi:DNA-binding protein Fis
VRKGGDSKNGRDPILEDFVEKKLLDFIRKARGSAGRNLYTLLVQEFEKPLITLTLKETGGNQIQASQLLGMNRNTLRKKIRTL